MRSVPRTNHLASLVDHAVWANHEWIVRLERQATEARLYELMSHILLSEQVWFQRIRGEPLDREIWRTLNPAEMSGLHERNRGVYDQLLSSDLHRQIAYQRFTGEHYESPVSDIVLHLCLHGAHHRGQMARYASEQKIAAPNVDFINYCIVHRV
jgi:uncharacterized damage-inducible protein DinB